MLKLRDFSSVAPAAIVPQAASIAWLCERYGQRSSSADAQRIEKLYRRYSVNSQQIAQRYTDLPDCQSTSPLDQHLFPLFGPPKGMRARMGCFRARTEEVFVQLYEHVPVAPDHLIHVTCTGYIAPSAAQVFASQMGWGTAITHAYHMGCYAALPAVRLAEGLARTNTQRIDIVHTELCTFHLDPSTDTPEQIVVQSLFADGHIRYEASNCGAEPGLQLVAIHEARIPQSAEMMTWIPHERGIAMTLAREVPEQLRMAIRPFLLALASKAGVDLGDLLRSALFAIHPGGPKIVEAMQATLELSDEQAQASREILRERGNMSSATLPHIWQRMLESASLASGQMVVSLAFGPGLTLFGGVFVYG